MSLVAPGSELTETLGPLKACVMLHELHQAAQPLTVLQGLLELALLSSATAEEYRGVIQRAAEESRRVSTRFDQMRKLIANSLPKTPDVPAKAETQGREYVHF